MGGGMDMNLKPPVSSLKLPNGIWVCVVMYFLIILFPFCQVLFLLENMHIQVVCP